MAVRHICTKGFGNGTFTGTLALIALRGFLAAILPTAKVEIKMEFEQSPVIMRLE